MSESNVSYPVGTIAKLFMISERRVQQLVKKGVIPKNEHGRYELVPTVQGYVRYLQERAIGRTGMPEDYQQEKARLTKIQADKAELELNEITGSLVSSEEIALEWFQMITDCKTRLLTIPAKAAPVVATEMEAGVVQNIIDDLMREALEELTEYEAK